MLLTCKCICRANRLKVISEENFSGFCCLKFLFLFEIMEDSIYLEDTMSKTFYVVSQHFRVQFKLEYCHMEKSESSPLLPPTLQISNTGSSQERTISSNDINKRYKCIYVCHTCYFLDYKVFYMKGMKNIYCINDERFLEKSKEIIR